MDFHLVVEGNSSSSFFFSVTRAWTQDLHLEPLHQGFFVKGFFRIGSQIFAQAGFEPWSSWSLPSE
jgi:hypothetical protein